mgnify:CR=1 FL=1
MFYGNYPQGEVIDHDIVESVINSTERMTYNNVNKILAGDKKLQEEYSHVCDLFFLMKELAEILQKTREIVVQSILIQMKLSIS